MTVDVPAAADTTLALNRLWNADPLEIRSFWRHIERYSAGASVTGGFRGGGHRAIVLHGWGCEMCILPDGRRQIFSLALPGDLVSLPRERDALLRTFVALTPLELMNPQMIPGRDTDGDEIELKSLTETEGRLFHHMVRLGQLTGYERVLNLFLELHDRLDAVGLVKDRTFRFPLTQDILADVLGLSIVHLNRTLQQLRREEFILVKGRTVTLNRLSEMKARALYQGCMDGAGALPC